MTFKLENVFERSRELQQSWTVNIYSLSDTQFLEHCRNFVASKEVSKVLFNKRAGVFYRV